MHPGGPEVPGLKKKVCKRLGNVRKMLENVRRMLENVRKEVI